MSPAHLRVDCRRSRHGRHRHHADRVEPNSADYRRPDRGDVRLRRCGTGVSVDAQCRRVYDVGCGRREVPERSTQRRAPATCHLRSVVSDRSPGIRHVRPHVRHLLGWFRRARRHRRDLRPVHGHTRWTLNGHTTSAERTCQFSEENGAGEWARTIDLLITNQFSVNHGMSRYWQFTLVYPNIRRIISVFSVTANHGVSLPCC